MALFNTPLMASLGATAPQVSGTDSFSVVENTSTSTVLATYSATGGLPVTWSVTGADASNFSIDSSGQLTFAVSPDYETVADRSQSINVVATNALGSDAFAISVTVTNDTSDDLPEITSGPSVINNVENTSTSTVLATYVASNGPITWSLESYQGSTTTGDHAFLEINSAGQLRWSFSQDHEDPDDRNGDGSFFFYVVATNANGSDQQLVRVNVTNDPSDDVPPTITVTGGGTTTNYTSTSFTLTASSNSADIHQSTSSHPKLYTLTVNEQMTIDFDVRGGGGGGVYGGNGGRVTGRATLNTGTTYRLIVGAAGLAATSSDYSAGGYGGGGSGGGGGEFNGSSFGDGGRASFGHSLNTGDIGDGGGGLSGVFSGSPSQGNAIIIAGGGGGTGFQGTNSTYRGDGGDGGGGSGTNQNGTDGATSGTGSYRAEGGSGATTSSGGAANYAGIQGNAGNAGGAGYGGAGGWSTDASQFGYTVTDREGGGGGGGGYYGGGGGGANYTGNTGGGGGGGSAYTSNAVSNVGGSRGYNSGQGRITITRV